MPSRAEDTDILIVGAGVVGLAIAATLARSRSSDHVVCIDRNPKFGLEISSRSSEVIHGGLYYEPGSLKARLCVEGAALSLERCAARAIAHRRRGKLVVAATRDLEPRLARLHERAVACGARDVELWSRAEIARVEPLISARAALYSPWTAVVDSHELMRSYAVEAADLGVDFAYRHTLVGLSSGASDLLEASVVDPAGKLLRVRARSVINAAGLGSDQVAAMAGIHVDQAGYRLRPCKGDYFALAPGAVRGISHLIYPVPEPDTMTGLGVHLTLDVAGQARLGPDTTYVPPQAITDFAVDPGKGQLFLEAGRRLLPWLGPDDLWPERSGIRPKLQARDEPPRDFVVVREAHRGLPGLVNLIGIESPGLTAAPAIARYVRDLLR